MPGTAYDPRTQQWDTVSGMTAINPRTGQRERVFVTDTQGTEVDNYGNYVPGKQEVRFESEVAGDPRFSPVYSNPAPQDFGASEPGSAGMIGDLLDAIFGP